MSQCLSLLLFGTSEFAIPAFRTIITSRKYDIKGIVTFPDAPSGRGQKLTPTPVKKLAEEFQLPVCMPTTLAGITLNETGQLIPNAANNIEEVNKLCEFTKDGIDGAVVISYGKIIPEALIKLPRSKIVNVHCSILPRWRGASPMQSAILEGDQETGVSIMAIEKGLDTGGVFALAKTVIGEEENFGSLQHRLAEMGAILLSEKLDAILNGTLKETPQSSAGVTYAHKFNKEDFAIKWESTALNISRRIRAFSPEPGMRSTLNGDLVKIFLATPGFHSAGGECGEIISVTHEAITVVTGDGTLAIKEMQFAGKKRLPISEILRGKKIIVGERFQ